MTEERSCYTCRHLRRETESWEMPHIVYWSCRARPQNSMLWQFPFSRTKCAAWEEREQKVPRETPFAMLKEE